jgi:uncharacterized SAM-binding protein YcdF (DUF218 family)
MLRFFFDWLACADPPAHADAIFVLAGLKSRKLYAIQLLVKAIAPRVLFSVGRFEIRRFPELGLPQTIDLLQMAQIIPPSQRHFFVLFENRQFTVQRIPVRALGTLSEIDALADWLDAHPETSSLLVVSSGPHLRRLRICCRALLPANVRIRFLAAPEESAASNPRHWLSDAATRKIVLFEWIKIACYFVFLPFWKLARPWKAKRISSSTP